MDTGLTQAPDSTPAATTPAASPRPTGFRMAQAKVSRSTSSASSVLVDTAKETSSKRRRSSDRRSSRRERVSDSKKSSTRLSQRVLSVPSKKVAAAAEKRLDAWVSGNAAAHQPHVHQNTARFEESLRRWLPMHFHPEATTSGVIAGRLSQSAVESLRMCLSNSLAEADDVAAGVRILEEQFASVAAVLTEKSAPRLRPSTARKSALLFIWHLVDVFAKTAAKRFGGIGAPGSLQASLTPLWTAVVRWTQLYLCPFVDFSDAPGEDGIDACPFLRVFATMRSVLPKETRVQVMHILPPQTILYADGNGIFGTASSSAKKA